MNFNNKIIWITGASSGIGRALAIKFAKQGASLILSSRDETKLAAVKNECDAYTNNCAIFSIDLSNEENIIETADKVLKNYNRIDYLINNGGISQRSYTIETPVDVDRKIMETNYFGAVTLTKAVLPRMIEQGGGHIAAVTSVVGKFGFPLRSAYSASKHALHGFFDTVRAELKNQNITVTLIVPGRIVTDISINAINKEGKKYGLMDQGQAAGMPADVCARKIVRALAKKKKEFLVGGKEVIMVHIRRFLPRLYYKLASRLKAT
ncbi:MAG: SDR family oxidoreductase [Bacteroidales bacterium]|nr:SDR family oxidoreductase [Bacteroidales bacterium]